MDASEDSTIQLAEGHLPESWSKEDLSVAYSHAMATAIGVSCETPKRDINGCDALFRGRDTATADAAQLSVQLKCTVDGLAPVNGGAELAFRLGRDDYEALRRTPTHPPRLLVVVEVPNPCPTHWVEVLDEKLLMHARAWYATLKGNAPLAEGQQTTTVRIPVAQRFNPTALRANMCSYPG
jgi:hypothetical protein